MRIFWVMLLFSEAPQGSSPPEVVKDHKKGPGKFPSQYQKQRRCLSKAFGHCLYIEDLLKGICGGFVVSHLIEHWVKS